MTKLLKNGIIKAIEPTTPMAIFDSYAQPGGTFFWEELEMRSYEKRILTISEQISELKSAKMIIESDAAAAQFLSRVEYYRFRGYSFQHYDNNKREYKWNTKFKDIVDIYEFDVELSHLLFSMLSLIEVSLRSRLVDALLTYKEDTLILYDPAVFNDKRNYWSNNGSLSQEIARSSDVFIKHNFDKHDGNIPVWAAVEIMSFGTLSKTIKNLKTGEGSAYSNLAEYYKYLTPSGNLARPSKKMLASWVQACVILRNICAHNSRIYNRALNTVPELLATDRLVPTPKYNGIYQTILAMKYLRPSNEQWSVFTDQLTTLISKYSAVIEMERLNFPKDWHDHLVIR